MLSEKLQQIFDRYNGSLPTKIAVQEGISKETLRQAALRGDIEKVRRGGYVLVDETADDYFLIRNNVSLAAS